MVAHFIPIGRSPILDADTRRRIDTARDILVGKVPDPKSQVEQITIALIYKFMNDMDAMSEELGGRRKFFTDDFARYGWAKLTRAGLGGHETLNLYAEAITRIQENPKVPQLFRNIFKNAFLPYRDPETLRAFLKIIDEFEYDHSERLGDAFEYLLSVLGSQGDAGQFRTPRHIIDFIVEIVDPKKDEKILDPACGTAGFLISAYKHVLEKNTDEDGGSALTPDERIRLAGNLMGYDISPDMERLSLANMYLHGFTDPHIFEYDTLTSEERWSEYADVILANPPFMSPKGGIRPHKRFSVNSKRSEVLFVDYMATHLTPQGRAGIIVPEGIIFQSQNAHRRLRKMLVEEYLVAVVSLPAGVFQPYSGVKTSVLILDKALAKRANHTAFFKIENDGYDLGAQRREIDKNDLPQAKAEIAEYLRRLRAEESLDDFEPTLGLIVEKEKIAENGEYNLGGERYRISESRSHQFPMVFVGDKSLFRVESGGTPKSDVGEYWNGGVPWVTLVDLPPTDFITEIRATQRTISEQGLKKSSARLIPQDSVLVSSRATIGRIAINRIPLATNQGFKNIVIENPSRVLPEYVALVLTKLVPVMDSWATGGTFKEISKSKFCDLQIPLPPLDVQKESVAEIEGYQKVIDGARAVVDNYRPHIAVDPEWPMVALGDTSLFRVESGGTPSSNVEEYWNSGVPWATLVDLPPTDFITEIRNTQRTISEKGLEKSSARLIPQDSVLVSTRATVGRIAINRIPLATNQGFKNVVIEAPNRALPEYVAFALKKLVPLMNAWATGGTFKELSKSKFSELQIPLPSLEIQQSIVAEIEAEQTMVESNRKLIDRFEKKIEAAVGRVWGEGETAGVEKK